MREGSFNTMKLSDLLYTLLLSTDALFTMWDLIATQHFAMTLIFLI